MRIVELEKNDILTKYIVYGEDGDGFSIPFLVLLPNGKDIATTFAVQFNTPATTRKDNLEEAYEELKEDRSYYSYLRMNKVPTIIPMIPRFPGYYMPYFTRRVFENQMDGLPLTDEEKESLVHVDKQVANMIRIAPEVFESLGCHVEEKAIICGYSASSKFVTAFAYLHPDVVKAIIGGGTTGLTIRPVKQIGDRVLKFPLGIGDLDDHLEEFSRIPQFYFIGEGDENDPALCLCEFHEEKDANGNLKAKKDENGHIIPILSDDGKYQSYYQENYSDEEVDTIFRIFGETALERFKQCEAIYRELGINATFKTYKGTHVSVSTDEELRHDLDDFVKGIIDTKEKRI